MTSKPEETVRRTFWSDLTGQSDRWGRTLVLTVVFGRLSALLIGLPILMLAGDGADDQFSGMADALTDDWVFAGLVFAPLIESLGIRLVVWTLGSRAGLNWPVWATALACGAVAVPLHGLSLMSMATAPFFALMAAIQHHWMNRGRGWAGFWLVVAIHLVVNALGMLAMVLIGSEAG